MRRKTVLRYLKAFIDLFQASEMKTDDILSTYAIQKNNKCSALEMYGRVRIEI